MKKTLSLTFAFLLTFAFIGCNKTTETTTTGLDYEMFYHLDDYNTVFNRREGTYLVYIYQPTCTGCEAIKDTVLEFADTYTGHVIYFFDVSKATASLQVNFLNMIGISSVEFGTPTLLLIINNSFDNTARSHYYFSGASPIQNILRDIEYDSYEYLE